MAERLNELTGELKLLRDQLSKAKGEIVDKIDKLTAALENVELPADAQATLIELKALGQGLDDLNPDLPPPPPPPPTV